MSRPTIEDTLKFMTTTAVGAELGLTASQVKKRLKKGTLPLPSRVTDNGVRLFDREWLRAARLIMSCERGQITPFELARELKKLEVHLEHVGSVRTRTDAGTGTRNNAGSSAIGGTSNHGQLVAKTVATT